MVKKVKCKNCKMFDGVCQIKKRKRSQGKKRICSYYIFNGKERKPLPSFRLPWRTSAERKKMIKQASMVKKIDNRAEQHKLVSTAINTMANPAENRVIPVKLKKDGMLKRIFNRCLRGS